MHGVASTRKLEPPDLSSFGRHVVPSSILKNRFFLVGSRSLPTGSLLLDKLKQSRQSSFGLEEKKHVDIDVVCSAEAAQGLLLDRFARMDALRDANIRISMFTARVYIPKMVITSKHNDFCPVDLLFADVLLAGPTNDAFLTAPTFGCFSLHADEFYSMVAGRAPSHESRWPPRSVIVTTVFPERLSAMKFGSLLFPVSAYSKHFVDLATLQGHIFEPSDLTSERANNVNFDYLAAAVGGTSSLPFLSLHLVDEFVRFLLETVGCNKKAADQEEDLSVRTQNMILDVPMPRAVSCDDVRVALVSAWQAVGADSSVMQEDDFLKFALPNSDELESKRTGVESDDLLQWEQGPSTPFMCWNASAWNARVPVAARVPVLRSRIAAEALLFLKPGTSWLQAVKWTVAQHAESFLSISASLADMAAALCKEAQSEDVILSMSLAKTQAGMKLVRDALTSPGLVLYRKSVLAFAQFVARSPQYSAWLRGQWLRVQILCFAHNFVDQPVGWSSLWGPSRTPFLRTLSMASAPVVADSAAVVDSSSPLLTVLPPAVLNEILCFVACSEEGWNSLGFLSCTCRTLRSAVDDDLLWVMTLVTAERYYNSSVDDPIPLLKALSCHADIGAGILDKYSVDESTSWRAKDWIYNLPGVNWRALARDFVAPRALRRKLAYNIPVCQHCGELHDAMTVAEREQLHLSDDEGFTEGFCPCFACHGDTGSWGTCEQYDLLVDPDPITFRLTSW